MTSADTVPVADRKTALRREVLARRRAIHEAAAAAAAAALAARIVGEIHDAENSIAGYWPLGDEIDCRPALEALDAKGCEVVLPVTAGQGQVLIFRRWSPGDVLEPGPFGTMHPGARAPLMCPKVLLLPLIAFDLQGHRLGYGAGYYDRTVAHLRQQHDVTVIGIAYDQQEVAEVPVGPHDQRMDAVMTESRSLWFNAPRTF